jgi:beta-galactosidase
VPLYSEVQQLGAEFDRAAPMLEGTTVESEVAVLHDYNSRWAVEWQRHNRAFDPVTSITSYYRPLHALMHSVDVVADTAPLDHYKLVVAPALNLLTPQAAQNLEAYVRGGGHLVLGQRSAMKDQDNSLFPQRQPGPLAELLGARVEQFYALDKPVLVTGKWGESENTIWAEQLGVSAPDTKILMRYGKSNGWLDGQPAAVTRRLGKGSITYIGAALDDAAMKRATNWMLEQAGLIPVLPGIPESVDVALRSGAGKRILILTNYATTPQTIPLTVAMEDVLSGSTISSVTLPQYGVAVLRFP